MKALTIIVSAVAASAAGVVLGMLFAPQKGSVTRRRISQKNHQYTDYLSDRFDDFVDTVSHSLESIEDETQRLAEKASAEVKKAAAEVNSN